MLRAGNKYITRDGEKGWEEGKVRGLHLGKGEVSGLGRRGGEDGRG